MLSNTVLCYGGASGRHGDQQHNCISWPVQSIYAAVVCAFRGGYQHVLVHLRCSACAGAASGCGQLLCSTVRLCLQGLLSGKSSNAVKLVA
jgi:hypothetical protein